MRNPLSKRLPREIKGDLGKYLVIFFLMILSIGFISGFLVADNSMLKAYQDGFSKYNIENGHFVTEHMMNHAQKKAIEKEGVTLYEQFYAEKETDFGATIRIYADRTQVNTVCLMDGTLPLAEDEIAVDRMFADNHKLQVGDQLTAGGRSYRITGLVALPDYSCLFEKNSDSMFDAVLFGVGIVSEQGLKSFDSKELYQCYAWKYETEPSTEAEEKKAAEELMKVINKEVDLKDFVPRYENQAICFTGEDMGSDRAMVTILLYMVIAILAFVFAITTANTIEKEANVIGTLRASGYTRGELVRHYMAMPCIITVISALIGNVLGYTVMKKICAAMYYHSYSLPTYETVWNADAFLSTTVVPVILMLLINFLILHRQMKLSPLQFLRRDLSRKKNKRAIYLSPLLKFFSRFRLRVIFQNMANYVMMLIGIQFAYVLLLFGLVMQPIMEHYQEQITDSMLAKYQYLLNMPLSEMDEDHKLRSMLAMLQFEQKVETKNKDAEKFSAYTLRTTDEAYMLEDILFYGIEPHSRYLPLELSEKDVYVSSAYADKYGLKIGDQITLKEKYEDKSYTFAVTGIYPYDAGLNVFMTREHLNEVFDLGEGMFGGYFCNSEITDIEEEYISTVIDLDALTKVSRQLELSMGQMMWLMCAFAVIIFLILVYLLSKIIIEKNAQSISMTKILGYSRGEIARLYILPTSVVVILCMLICIPITNWEIGIIWRIMIQTMMTGWLPYWTPDGVYAQMFLTGFSCYLIVAVLELRRIKKVPMDMALKNVE